MGNPFAPRTKSGKTPQQPKMEENKDTSATTHNDSEVVDVDTTPRGTEIEDTTKKPLLEVPDATAEGVLDWVGDDKDKAAAALEKEKSQSKPRKSLVAKLEAV